MQSSHENHMKLTSNALITNSGKGKGQNPRREKGKAPGPKREKGRAGHPPHKIPENQASHTLSDLARDARTHARSHARTHARTKRNDFPVPGGSTGTSPP